MIKSMTGYGKAENTLDNKKISVEIKSLNSKQTDLNVRMPSIYKEKELEIRKMVSSQLIRGKMDVSIYLENSGDVGNYQLNTELIQNYYNQLKALDFVENKSQSDLLAVLMRMPDVMKNERPTLEEEEWLCLKTTVEQALNKIDDFREQEGAALEKDLLFRIDNIKSNMKNVFDNEADRVEKIRERILSNLKENFDSEGIDQNRFEQELVYYLEKLDITEEKIRLENHCKYFVDTINLNAGQGKKLGFIGQEMGREINTIGSKANDSEIQKFVVNMKDELEKIKEQVLNVL